MSTPIILFDNRFDDGTPTATSTAPGFNVLNIRDGKTYTYWRAAHAGTNFITVDCGHARTADFFSTIGHNLRTANATVFVESSADNITWTDRSGGFTLPSDRAFFIWFSPVSARFWRVRIVTATVTPFMAIVLLGTGFTFPFPPDTPYIPYRETIEAESVIGKTGHILGSVIRYRPIQISARFSNLSRDWVMNVFLPHFWNNHASLLRPFFWLWNARIPEMLYFVTIDKEASFEMPLSVSSLVDSIELNMRGIMEI